MVVLPLLSLCRPALALPDALRVALRADIGGDLVGEHAFRVAHAADDRGDALARLAREALIRDGLEELPDPKTARVAGRAAGRQRMVGADALVAVGDRALLAQEQSAVVAQDAEATPPSTAILACGF